MEFAAFYGKNTAVYANPSISHSMTDCCLYGPLFLHNFFWPKNPRSLSRHPWISRPKKKNPKKFILPNKRFLPKISSVRLNVQSWRRAATEHNWRYVRLLRPSAVEYYSIVAVDLKTAKRVFRVRRTTGRPIRFQSRIAKRRSGRDSRDPQAAVC